MPCAPFAAHALSTASRTSPWAPGLNVASATTPSFMPCTVRVAEATTGSEIVARVSVTVRARRVGARAWTATSSVTSVPGGPLISAIAAFRREARERAPVHGDDQLRPPSSPARAAGEESNTRAISRPRCAAGRRPRRSR